MSGVARSGSQRDLALTYHEMHITRRNYERKHLVHGLPIATGRLAGAGHVGRADRVCLACNSGGVGDEKHMIFECTALAPLRQQHADLFTPRTDTMRSFFAQQIIWGF